MWLLMQPGYNIKKQPGCNIKLPCLTWRHIMLQFGKMKQWFTPDGKTETNFCLRPLFYHPKIMWWNIIKGG
jgi:hypothetical protein